MMGLAHGCDGRGNPNNGIVMVAGQPGAVEGGTLVHVVNDTSGFEALVLAGSDGSFSTDLAAFANDVFSIFTVDAAGNQSAGTSLPPVTPLTLTLDAIGNQIAPLGEITCNQGVRELEIIVGHQCLRQP